MSWPDVVEREPNPGPYKMTDRDFGKTATIQSIARYLRRYCGLSKDESLAVARKSIDRAELLAQAYIK